MWKKTIDNEDVKHIAIDVEMSDDMNNKGTKILYTSLIQYTKGDATMKVNMNGMAASMDSYRHITYKGRMIPSNRKCKDDLK